MRRNVRGRVILVTGSSRNIGRRVAEMLAERGAKIVLTGREQTLLDDAARAITAIGAEVITVAADLTVAADRERLRDAIIAKFGGLDVLINNAGLASFGEFATSEEAMMRTLMEINFFTPIEMIRLMTPLLRESADQGKRDGSGWRPAIVNIGSVCGRLGIPSYPEHSASKFAISGMTDSLRPEYSRFDIDVLLVVPGSVKMDDRQRHYLRHEGRIALDFNKGIPQETVASGIVTALERNRRETVIGGLPRFLLFSKRMAPRVLEWFMIRKVRNFEQRAKQAEDTAANA